MSLFPDWAPNIHPLIIHFPIALLLVALVVDLSALIFRKADWLKKSAVGLYVLGALGTFAAYLTGKQAADVVSFPSASYPVISRHADLALYTTIFFGLYALVRLFLFWRKRDSGQVVALLLFLIAAAGYGLVQQTAEKGGMLVFRYGVGTQALKIDSTAVSPAGDTKAAEIVVSDNGSWTWQGDAEAFRRFNLLQGHKDGLRVNPSEEGLVIDIPSPQPFLLTFGPPLANIEITARVNLDAFKGRFALVHHAASADVYDYFAIQDGRAELGRMTNGQARSFDAKALAAQGWLTLKAVSSSGHYRGYVNEKLVVHGHAKDLPPGPTGFAFSGSGVIRISGLQVVSLDEKPVMNRPQEHSEQMGTMHQESGGEHV